MVTVGVVSPGHMGSALGQVLAAGGARVVTTIEGRSRRTRRLAAQAGLKTLDDLDAVVSTSDVVLSVTPPAAAVDNAVAVASAALRTRATPLVADLNAVSPATMRTVGEVLRRAGLELVDGAISGAPPSIRPGALLYFSGRRAKRVVDLPWTNVRPRVVANTVGSASALKMCTASVYKGLTALCAHAMLTAQHHGVLEPVVTDLTEGLGFDPAYRVALAASKSRRFVPEMREISGTQGAAGLTPDLFTAMAQVYEMLTHSELADASPETVTSSLSAAEVVARLAPGRGR
ncbi:MAG: DUF1932 domain-containing protein [Micromonosporaceae bacterium]